MTILKRVWVTLWPIVTAIGAYIGYGSSISSNALGDAVFLGFISCCSWTLILIYGMLFVMMWEDDQGW